MGTSIVEEQKRNFLQAIRQTSGNDWKVLVLDETSRKLLYNVVTEDDVLNCNIITIERIEDRREHQPETDAIYLLSPLPHIVEQLKADLARRRYRKGFLIWTSTLPRNLGQDIFSSDSRRQLIASTMDLNVSGSGNLSLDADVAGDVEADVSGSGDIVLKGKCKNFNSDVSGSGKVDLNMAIASEAEFGISGSGKILASGSASVVKAHISGSGKVLAANLTTDRCDIRISGSGDVEINVQTELDANISGSGTVSYKGNPSKVNSHASGSGKVSKM